MERAGNPIPNVLLMLSIALGVWVLVYVAAASVWSWQKDRSEIVTESKHHQQVAVVAHKAEAKLQTRRRAKVNHRRPRATSLAARVFRSTI
jgi:ABC-type lipoprotein release transport system permease subunit